MTSISPQAGEAGALLRAFEAPDEKRHVDRVQVAPHGRDVVAAAGVFWHLCRGPGPRPGDSCRSRGPRRRRRSAIRPWLVFFASKGLCWVGASTARRPRRSAPGSLGRAPRGCRSRGGPWRRPKKIRTVSSAPRRISVRRLEGPEVFLVRRGQLLEDLRRSRHTDDDHPARPCRRPRRRQGAAAAHEPPSEPLGWRQILPRGTRTGTAVSLVETWLPHSPPENHVLPGRRRRGEPSSAVRTGPP